MMNLDAEPDPGPRPSAVCANARCRTPLGVDHVTLITTCHVRRFCTVECIAEGQQAHLDALRADADADAGYPYR